MNMQIFDKTNLSLMIQSKVNQWQNAQNLIVWFRKLKKKAMTNSKYLILNAFIHQ